MKYLKDPLAVFLLLGVVIFAVDDSESPHLREESIEIQKLSVARFVVECVKFFARGGVYEIV